MGPLVPWCFDAAKGKAWKVCKQEFGASFLPGQKATLGTVYWEVFCASFVVQSRTGNDFVQAL